MKHNLATVVRTLIDAVGGVCITCLEVHFHVQVQHLIILQQGHTDQNHI